ncbi:hypothetical protein [Cellulomonas fengjieae]|uniref:hypothetical protein n=1 Tax=Cellulomonas fengjieae TaxID=2819978 RepID=UPI001AAF0A81|nr:hypothetical protein [Cellulomonas fengjieae]MBO3103912.1 hypothetical protein [Cellulomonas fengjieae]
MSTDDQFVAHLRALESAPPGSTIDPHRVLLAGRRRRVGRGAGVAALTLVAVTGLYTGVSALPDPVRPAPPSTSLAPVPSPSVTPMGPRAVVDPTGDVTLPFAEYYASPDQNAAMMTAHYLAISRCMTDAGFPDAYRFIGPETPEPGFPRYGVTSAAQVERDGYTFPSPEPISGTDLNLDVPGARDALAACLPRVLALGFVFEPGDENGLGQPPYAPTQAKDTPEGQALLAELSACLLDRGAPGVDTADGVIIPTGVLDLPHEEQVRIGLLDLECRQSMDFLQRFADVDAAQQQQYIDDNRAYFDAYKAMRDASLAASYAYLDAAGIVMDR